MAKRNPKAVKANCDRLARQCVRLRDKMTCQKCDTPTEEGECAHVKIRKYNATRFDLQNLLYLCHDCHTSFDVNIIIGKRWFEDKFPERANHLAEIERNWDERVKTWRLQDFIDVENNLKKIKKELEASQD